MFDRYPRLKVAYMEGGAGWLPFWMERLDEHMEKLAPQMPEMRRPPSEVIQSDRLVLSCESEETGLDRVLDATGSTTVLYASDVLPLGLPLSPTPSRTSSRAKT